MAKLGLSLPSLRLPSLKAQVPLRRKRKKKEKKLPPGAEKRRIKRITLEELNAEGAELLRSKLPEIKKLQDRRPAYMKVLDVLDLPRNVVANVVGSAVGLDKSKKERATLGLRRVTTSDILGKLGVKNKVVKGIAGFIGDVAIDPLTYATLGATTGLNIGKNVPKLLKSGSSIFRTAAKTGRITDDAAKALGTTVAKFARSHAALVRKRGATQAAKLLMQKRGGLLTRRLSRNVLSPKSLNPSAIKKLESARQFFAKHGEQGRTLFRLPFAAKGLALPFGKRAQLWRKFSGFDPLQFKKQVEIAGEAVRKARAGAVVRGEVTKLATVKTAVQQARELTKAKAQARRVAQGEAAVQRLGEKFVVTPKGAAAVRKVFAGPARLNKAERARQAANLKRARALEAGFEARRGEAVLEAGRAGAREKALRGAADAPLSDRLAAEAALGQPALGDLPADATKLQRFMQGARRLKNQVFGPGSSPLRQQELAVAQQVGMGKAVSALRTNEQFTKIVDPLVARMAVSLGTNTDDAMIRLVDIMEAASEATAITKKGAAKLPPYHALDPIQKTLRQTIDTISKDPDLMRDMNKVVIDTRKFLDNVYQETVRANVQPGRISEFFLRAGTDEFNRVSAPHLRRLGGKDAWTIPRVRLMEFQAKGADETIQILTSDRAKIAEWRALVKAGEADNLGTFRISTRWWNTPQDRKWGQKLSPAEFQGAQFKTNISQALGSARAQADQRIGAATLRDLARKTGTNLPADDVKRLLTEDPAFRNWAIPNMNEKSPMFQGGLNQLKGQAFPQPVADMLERATQVTVDLGEMERIVRGSDKLLNIWKSFTLLHPAYTTRNVLQNIIGGAMAGMPANRTVAATLEVRRIVDAVLKGKPITGTINIAGQTVPAIKFADEIRTWNLVNSSFMTQAMTPSMFENTKSLLKRGFRRWFQFNNSIESSMKAGIFKAFLDDGLDVQQAVMKTIQAMPDMTDLSRFEKNVMLRVFPWYRWFKANTRLQMFHFLPNKPAFAAGGAKFQNAIEQAMTGGDIVERQLRPEWQQEAQAMQIGGDSEEGRVFLLASWLPFQEMTKLFAGTMQPSEAARFIFEQVRPGARAFTEFASGTDFFRRTQLPKFTLSELVLKAPQALAGKSGTPLDNFLTIRPVREAFRVQDIPGVVGKLQRGLLGGALQPVSRLRGLKAEGFRLRQELATVRSRINRALQVNDKSLAATLTTQWFRILRRMHQLGIPGVPKASAALLEQAGIAAGSGLRGAG